MTKSSVGRSNTPSAAELPADFTDFVHALNANGVEYLLVGGYAVGVHGYLRATADIDFFYRRTPENVTRVLAALAEFGAPPVVFDRAHLETADVVTAFGQPPMRIDLLSGISGVTFDDALDGSLRIHVGGDVVPVIGLRALLANKEASGRPKDRLDLEQLGGASMSKSTNSPRKKRR
ncbi:MAG: nucleotidyltransferase [Gemmatimonadaceae bacterium]|nr:nucleotidyltransferase [Gemmatimonadaceae bacterium]